jgi:hypothetical protein
VQTLKELGDCAIHEIEIRSRLLDTAADLRDAKERVKRLEATLGATARPAR